VGKYEFLNLVDVKWFWYQYLHWTKGRDWIRFRRDICLIYWLVGWLIFMKELVIV